MEADSTGTDFQIISYAVLVEIKTWLDFLLSRANPCMCSFFSGFLPTSFKLISLQHYYGFIVWGPAFFLLHVSWNSRYPRHGFLCRRHRDARLNFSTVQEKYICSITLLEQNCLKFLRGENHLKSPDHLLLSTVPSQAYWLLCRILLTSEIPHFKPCLSLTQLCQTSIFLDESTKLDHVV